MQKLLLVFLAFFHLTNGEKFTMDLEDYNGWNLPYSKSVYVNVTDEYLAPYVLNDTFQLLCNMNAYFGVIFTGRPLPDLPSSDH